MSKTKKIIREIHGITGLLVGIVIVIVSLSGCVYAFQAEIRNLLYPHLLKVNVPEHAQKLSADSIVSIASAHYPESPIREIAVHQEPENSIKVSTWDHHQIYVCPYTGQVLGMKNQRKDPFLMAWSLHTQLGLGKIGGKIVAWSTLACLPLVFTGIWLWWPIVRRSWRKAFRLPLQGKWKSVNFQWHKNGGFYTSIVLLLVCLTGLMMSFSWFEDGIYRITGSPLTHRNPPKAIEAPRQAGPIQNALAYTIENFPQHKETAIFFPSGPEGVYTFYVKNDDQLGRRNILYFNPADGELLQGRYYDEYSVGEKLKAVNYNIHSGKVGGMPGRILVFVATLFTTYLVISGIIMWCQRKFKLKPKTR